MRMREGLDRDLHFESWERLRQQDLPSQLGSHNIK